MTHRQYLAWDDWLCRQMDVPSRDNYYEMQTTQAVVAAHRLKAPKGLVLKLDRRGEDADAPQKTSWTVEESTAMWKARNAQRYGAPIGGKRS